jgi:hypothetical protein
VTGDPAGDLRMYEFDLRTGAYTGKRWTYTLDSAGHSVADVVTVDANRFLVLERDSTRGDSAVFKKVFLVDRRDQNGDGKLDKTLLVDLLDLANPDGLGGFGPVFRFPFFTIEGLILLDDGPSAC